MRKSLLAVGSLMVLVLCTCLLAQPKGKEIKLLQTWSGKSADDNLRKAAPANGFVADAEVWKKLWKTWRGEAAVPEIDFSKDLVLVSTGDGPNQLGIMARLDDAGNVTVMGMSTMMAGPGFCYGMARISREGVKSVGGKPVGAAPATKPAE